MEKNNIDLTTIDHLADLSNLTFTEEEKVIMMGEVSSIIDMLTACARAKTDGIEDEELTMSLDALREDIPMQTLNIDTVFENSTRCEKNYFTVPKVVE